MQWPKWFILVGAVLFATALIVIFNVPNVRAQECQGESIPDIVTMVEAAGGRLLDLIDVPGDGFDQVLVIEVSGAIVVGKVLGGCAIGGPMALGKSVPMLRS